MFTWDENKQEMISLFLTHKWGLKDDLPFDLSNYFSVVPHTQVGVESYIDSVRAEYRSSCSSHTSGG